MSSGSINRKDFLVLSLSTVTLASLVEACGDDSAPAGGTAGSSSGGSSAGSGTAGAGTGGSSASTGGATSGGNGGAVGSGGKGGVAGSGGTPGTGGSSQAGGSGQAGSSGRAGGSAQTGGGGQMGGSGQAGVSGQVGGSPAGGRGQAGGSCQPVGASGEAGADGSSDGCIGEGMCGAATIVQPGVNPPHTHVSVGPYDLDEAGVTQLRADLKAHINGATPTKRFTVPASSDGHTHTINLSAAQVTSLRAGMTVTDVVSSKDPSGEAEHVHIYTIGCSV